VQQKTGVQSANKQTTNVPDRDTNSDDGSIEDIDPNPALGNRKQKGADGLILKDQAADLVKEAGNKGRKAAIEKTEKEPSLKIKIKLDLNAQVKLDAHIDGVARASR
jgi:hypothetical protein